MLTTQTIDKLRSLKLSGMVKGLEEQSANSEYTSMSFEERLGLLVDIELTMRENRRLKTRLSQAKLRLQACVEDIDYNCRPGLDRSFVRSLYPCQWIKEAQNILITGPTGAGKSFLACALAHRACMLGYKARYFSTSKLFEELRLASADGRYSKIMKSIGKTDLIVIDDWGLCELNDHARKDLFEIMEDRYRLKSTIIVAQLPLEHWHKMIGHSTFADAILDRLIHNAYKIALKGGSMRKRQNKNL